MTNLRSANLPLSLTSLRRQSAGRRTRMFSAFSPAPKD